MQNKCKRVKVAYSSPAHFLAATLIFGNATRLMKI